jgi:hypothetical protein
MRFDDRLPYRREIRPVAQCFIAVANKIVRHHSSFYLEKYSYLEKCSHCFDIDQCRTLRENREFGRLRSRGRRKTAGEIDRAGANTVREANRNVEPAGDEPVESRSPSDGVDEWPRVLTGKAT